MKKRCVLRAPAKLNLHLEIGEGRSDGFHEIRSLFIMTDLYDEVSLRSLKTGNYCRITGDFNCRSEDNLIYKAWKEFARVTGKDIPADFNVVKRIPSFAGLGGGSSDAAAALRVLDSFFETGLSAEELADLGAMVGSDVPFFLSSAAAVIEGRGEIVTPLEPSRVLNILIVQPDIRISTPDAYSWVDESRPVKAGFVSSEKIIDLYRGNLENYSGFKNDFSKVLTARFKVFDDVIEQLKASGAVYSNITGSGSAVFGLYETDENAEKAEKRMQNEYKFVQKIKSLDRIPYAILE